MNSFKINRLIKEKDREGNDELFFDIPNEGDINSHRYILQREAEYLGVKFADDVDIQALLQEITDLRQQLLTVETENVNLTEQISNGR